MGSTNNNSGIIEGHARDTMIDPTLLGFISTDHASLRVQHEEGLGTQRLTQTPDNDHANIDGRVDMDAASKVYRCTYMRVLLMIDTFYPEQIEERYSDC